MKPSTLYAKIFFSLMLCKVYFSIIDDSLQTWISFQGLIMTRLFFFFFNNGPYRHRMSMQ